MFRSFFSAGFECATGYNKHGQWIDQIAATGHDIHLDADYRRLSEVGIYTAREGVRWPLVDKGGKGASRYDFRSLAPFVEAARRHEIEVVWDLFHYGFPDGLDLLGEEFPRRFADYCYAVARYIGARTEGTCYFTPVNEPSFFAHSAGEKGLFAPYLTGLGWELKVALCRAAIAGINAIWAAVPGARIVNADPLCYAAIPYHKPEYVDEAHDFNDRLVYQSWDMIAGRLLPELGGSRKHLDIVGINYYWTNQWEWRVEPQDFGPLGSWLPPLTLDDPRHVPLSRLMENVHRHFGGEVMLSETGHVGPNRAPWLRYVAEQCEVALNTGVPLRGACLYPILGMPEWHRPEEWADMGLWEGHRNRAPHTPALQALAEARHLDRYATPPTQETFRYAHEVRSDKYALALAEADAGEAELEQSVTVGAPYASS